MNSVGSSTTFSSLKRPSVLTARFLHVSDLHFGAGRDAEIEVGLSRLLENLDLGDEALTEVAVIEAGGEHATLTAARALTPMPR